MNFNASACNCSITELLRFGVVQTRKDRMTEQVTFVSRLSSSFHLIAFAWTKVPNSYRVAEAAKACDNQEGSVGM